MVVVEGQVFVSFREQLLDPRGTEAHCETDIPGTTRSNENLATPCVDRDDELHVLLEQLVDWMGNC